jgi:hypothetical protein
VSIVGIGLDTAVRLPPDVPAERPVNAPRLPTAIYDDDARRRFSSWCAAILGVRVRWCHDRPQRYSDGPTLALVTGGPWRVNLVRELLAETPGAGGVEVVGEA